MVYSLAEFVGGGDGQTRHVVHAALGKTAPLGQLRAQGRGTATRETGQPPSIGQLGGGLDLEFAVGDHAVEAADSRSRRFGVVEDRDVERLEDLACLTRSGVLRRGDDHQLD